MQPEINQMLGETSTPTEENPLAKIEEASKDASKKKPETKDKVKSFDDETFKQMLMTGDNKEGLFVPNEDKKEEEKDPKHAEVDESATIKQGKVGKPQGKYVNNFLKDITKNPNEYKVNTPKGEMTIAEAMRKGYNPITKRFEKDKDSEEVKKKHLKGLNDADKAKLEEITSPSAARIPAKDAATMGLPGDSPMIAGSMPPETGGQPPVAAPTPAPEGASGEPQAGLDIASMLGGAA